MKAKYLIKQLQQFDPESEIMVGDAANDANGYSEYFNFIIHDREEDLKVTDGHPYIFLEAVFYREGVIEHTKDWR